MTAPLLLNLLTPTFYSPYTSIIGTPLVSAAAGDYLDTVVALLNAGADIQGTNLEENTALHEATALEHPVRIWL